MTAMKQECDEFAVFDYCDIESKTVFSSEEQSFNNICELLKSAKLVLSFTIKVSLDAADLLALGNSLAHNRSITTLDFKITHSIDREAFQHFSNSITANNDTLKKIVFDVRNIPALASIKGLKIATKTFEVRLQDIQGSYYTDELYLTLADVLKSTKIDALVIEDRFGPFYPERPEMTTVGVIEFFNHVAAQNSLKEFHFDVMANQQVFSYLTKLIELTTSLRAIKVSYIVQEAIPALVEALSKRSLKRLTLSTFEATVEPEHWLKLAKFIRSMDKLTDLHIYGTRDMDIVKFLTFVRESESLRKIYVTKVMDSDTWYTECNNIALRNIKLQNSRVLSLITVLFNIARDKSHGTTHTIPHDVWPTIASFVSIPGVSLDFGHIALSIFKDPVTLRRVINRPVNKRVKTVPRTKLPS